MCGTAPCSAGCIGHVVSASSCSENKVIVALIESSSEMEQFFFGLFEREQGVQKKGLSLCEIQQVESRLWWYHEILWFNKMISFLGNSRGNPGSFLFLF